MSEADLMKLNNAHQSFCDAYRIILRRAIDLIPYIGTGTHWQYPRQTGRDASGDIHPGSTFLHGPVVAASGSECPFQYTGILLTNSAAACGGHCRNC